MKAIVLSAFAAVALAGPVVAQGHAHHAAAQPSAVVEVVGMVKGIDVRAGTMTVAHEPVAALGWPAMTMSFKVAAASLLSGLKAGDRISFQLKGQQVTAVKRL